MMNFVQYAHELSAERNERWFTATNAPEEMVDIIENEMGYDLWIGSRLHGTYEDFDTAVRYAETEVPFTVKWMGEVIAETRG